VVEGQFSDFEGSESVGSSHRDFCLVVETLNDPAGEHLSGFEVVQDEVAMAAEHARHLLHRLDAGEHGLVAPRCQEFGGPGGRLVFPELLEVFFEQVGADGLQVEAEQIPQAEPLVPGEVRFSFEKTPAGFLQEGFMPSSSHLPGFGGAHFIQGFVQFGDDVKPVQDVQRLGALLTNHVEVRLPHVGTDKLDFGRKFRSDHGEEPLEGCLGPLLSHPEQPGEVVDLVDQGQVLLPFGILNLVYADGKDGPQDAMCEAPLDHVLHRIKDFFPGGLERFGYLFPTQLACPVRQELHVDLGQVVFAASPGHFFHHYRATLPAIHPPHAIEEEHQKSPQRDELESPFVEVIVAGTRLVTTRAHRSGTAPRAHAYLNGLLVVGEPGRLVDESGEAMALV
jgi:hypothetical protein